MRGESAGTTPVVSNGEGAKNCTKKFGRVAKALWPRKTVAELVLRTGVRERAVKYWLSGKYPPSARAILAVMRELDQ